MGTAGEVKAAGARGRCYRARFRASTARRDRAAGTAGGRNSGCFVLQKKNFILLYFSNPKGRRQLVPAAGRAVREGSLPRHRPLGVPGLGRAGRAVPPFSPPSPLPAVLPSLPPSLPLRSAGRGARRRGARRSGALPLRGEAGRPEMADARGVRGERSGARGSPWPFRCVARGGKGRRGSVCGLPAGRRRVCGARLRSPRADSGHGAASLPRGLCRTSHRLFQFERCFHVLLLVKLVGLLEAEDGESGAD